MNDTILQSVIEKLKSRSEAGQKKYGTTLDRNDLTLYDWLNHLQEELMDAIQYIEKLKHETHHHQQR
jgi:succinate dehydrogenase flavin-adding protein (antitoxin of CptAB toxin-antitoxin module)